MIKELVIQSSVLERVAYSYSQRLLIVLFKNGQQPVWEYRDVGAESVSVLESAPSQGSQFAKAIRSKHPEVRIGSGASDFEDRCDELGLDTTTALATFYRRLDEARQKRTGRPMIRF